MTQSHIAAPLSTFSTFSLLRLLSALLLQRHCCLEMQQAAAALPEFPQQLCNWSPSSYPLDQLCLSPTTLCSLHSGSKFLSSSHLHCSFVAIGHSLSKLAAVSMRSHLCHRELSLATNCEILQLSLYISPSGWSI